MKSLFYVYQENYNKIIHLFDEGQNIKESVQAIFYDRIKEKFDSLVDLKYKVKCDSWRDVL